MCFFAKGFQEQLRMYIQDFIDQVISLQRRTVVVLEAPKTA